MIRPIVNLARTETARRKIATYLFPFCLRLFIKTHLCNSIAPGTSVYQYHCTRVYPCYTSDGRAMHPVLDSIYWAAVLESICMHPYIMYTDVLCARPYVPVPCTHALSYVTSLMQLYTCTILVQNHAFKCSTFQTHFVVRLWVGAPGESLPSPYYIYRSQSTGWSSRLKCRTHSVAFIL